MTSPQQRREPVPISVRMELAGAADNVAAAGCTADAPASPAHAPSVLEPAASQPRIVEASGRPRRPQSSGQPQKNAQAQPLRYGQGMVRHRNCPRLLAASRHLLAVACGMVTLLAASCGFDVQTLQPYTPAMGINVEVGTDRQVLVRNLMIVTDDGGTGVVSATLYAEPESDALVAVAATADALDGDGAPLTATVEDPVPVPADGFVVLTDLPPITVTGPGLRPGMSARITLTFAQAGTVTTHVPIMSTEFASLDKATEFEQQ